MGLRPALSLEVATYNARQKQCLQVKPGITCYWQTRRNRDSITFDKWVDLDLWTGWCSFFLEAVAAQARENLGKAKRINLLYRDVRTELVEKSHSTFAEKAADALFSRPIFSAKDFASIEGVKPKTARRLLGHWRKWVSWRSFPLIAVSGPQFSIFLLCLQLPKICNRGS